MFRKVSDFVKDWESEKESTLKIFRALTDESLSYKFHDDLRSLGRLAWHITNSLSEMGRMTGMELTFVDEKLPIPDSAEEIAGLYSQLSSEIVAAVSKWNDEMLEEEVSMYGEKWTRGFTLLVLVRHQIHHRAQMTVLMRQSGLKVPGIYGPSKEEWVQYNMQPQE
jgi:uncharacterized damage-inducible protein DinB